MQTAARLSAALTARQLTLATAESVTAGAVGDLVSAAPGASDIFVGGVIAYATRVKQQVLGVSEATVSTHGVVSAQCAAEMALGVRSLLGSDLGVSTTGVAGPTGQEGKPVGLVYVGVADVEGALTVELRLLGRRSEIREQAAVAAVEAVLDRLRSPA